MVEIAVMDVENDVLWLVDGIVFACLPSLRYMFPCMSV